MMKSTYTYLPNQFVTEAHKKKESWWKPTMDHYIARAFQLNNPEDARRHIMFANGDIDMSTYEYLLRPMIPVAGMEKLLKQLPGQLRSVDYITYIREKYQGEYMSLPYKAFVKSNNPDVVMEFNHNLQKKVYQHLEMKLVTLMNQNGMDTNMKDAPDIDLEAFVEKEKKAFFDDRAIKIQDRLELINDETDWDTLRHQLFFNWFATETVYDYRYVDQNGKFVKEAIAPDEGFPIHNGTPYVDTSDGFLWSKVITWQQFLEKYNNRLSDKEIEYVESLMAKGSNKTTVGGVMGTWGMLRDRVIDSYGEAYYDDHYNKMEDYYVTAQDMTIQENIIQYFVPRKIKELTFRSQEDGKIYDIEVDDTYKLNPEAGDIRLDDKWISESYTGVRIGDEHSGVYVEPEKDITQRVHSGNTLLHFTGKRGLMEGIKINPIPKRLAEFQAMDRVLLLHTERAMAKMKDAILIMPKSVLSDDKKEVREQYFHLLVDGTYVYDDAEITADEVSKSFRFIGNPNVDSYLRTLMDLRRDNKNEMMEVGNMNPSRAGSEQSPYMGKGARQQDIFRAKISSVLMIHILHKAFERSHQADLDISKAAWVLGKKGSYFNKKRNEMVEVDVDALDHFNTYYGIYIVDSKAEEEDLQAFKDIGFAASQNGEVGVAVAAIGMDSTAEGRKVLTEIDEKNKERAEQQANAANAAIQQKTETEAKDKEADRQMDYTIAQMKEEGDTFRTMLQLNQAIIQTDGTDLYSEVEKQTAKNTLDYMAQSFKERELATKVSEGNKDRKLKKEQMESSERIAKMNKN